MRSPQPPRPSLWALLAREWRGSIGIVAFLVMFAGVALLIAVIL